MHALNNLVVSGKVLYLGISDTPAWIVSKANECKHPLLSSPVVRYGNVPDRFFAHLRFTADARNHGLRPFCVYQGLWNAAMRDFERDIIPMCEAEGMAIAPWSTLGGGKFKTEDEFAKQEGRQVGPPSENDKKVSKVLEKIAKNKSTVMTSVVRTMHPYLTS